MNTPPPKNIAKEEVGSCGKFDRDLLWDLKTLNPREKLNLKKLEDVNRDKNVFSPPHLRKTND